MEIELILKIAAIGLIVALLSQVLSRADKSEYAMIITLVGVVAALLIVIPQLGELFEAVKQMLEYGDAY